LVDFAGTMGLEFEAGVLADNLGTLYSLEKDGTVKARHGPVTISNGLAWSDDSKIMYYNDSKPRQVYAFDFDIQSGDISEYACGKHENIWNTVDIRLIKGSFYNY
jgi:gluconolactonase